MDESGRPPIPGRPERTARNQAQTDSNTHHQIRSIANLCPENRVNDYVETSSLPPRITRPPKFSSETKTDNDTKHREQKENIQNERKELLQQAPEIPPRRPPPRQASLHRHRERVDIHTTSDLKHRAAPKPPDLQTNNRKLNNATVLISTSGSNQNWLFLPPVRRQTNNNQPITNHETNTQPITTQPTNDIMLSMNGDGTVTNSIMCKNCKQCRCASCTEDRELPEHWLCDDTCRCNAESVVNTLSCMYCATHCLRKCFSDNRQKSKDFCSCTGSVSNIFARWTALTALSTVVPCLCCYWPLRGCTAIAKRCYNSSCVRQQGCTCDEKS